MTEMEYLDKIDNELQVIFDVAVSARDNAQAALSAVKALKHRLLERKIELQRAELERAK